MEELIAKRYAQALTSALANTVDTLEFLNVLAEVLIQPEVKTVLMSPIVSGEKKTEMVLSALGKNAEGTLINFIKILGENDRLYLIPTIVKVLNAEQQRIANHYDGIVKTASALSETSMSTLEETLTKYTGATIKLKQELSSLNELSVLVDDLGIEVNFSKQRVKEQLIDFIKKSL